MTRQQWNALIATRTLNLISAMNRILREAGSDGKVPAEVTQKMLAKMQSLPMGDRLGSNHVYTYNSEIICDVLGFNGQQALWPLFDNLYENLGTEKEINWMERELTVLGETLTPLMKEQICRAFQYYTEKAAAVEFIKTLAKEKRKAAFEVFKSTNLETLKLLCG